MVEEKHASYTLLIFGMIFQNSYYFLMYNISGHFGQISYFKGTENGRQKY